MTNYYQFYSRIAHLILSLVVGEFAHAFPQQFIKNYCQVRSLRIARHQSLWILSEAVAPN